MSDHIDSDFEDDDDGEFTAATEHVQRSHDKYNPDDLLSLYGLYKQATVGNCNTDKPGIFNIQSRAKWNAWEALKNMNQEEAKYLYVKKVKEIDNKFLEKPNGFTSNSNKWVVHSVQMPPTDLNKPEHEMTIFDFVKDGNVSQVERYSKFGDINQLDENGIGLLHWAADRNHPAVLKFLLQLGANPNLQDIDQQTPLHYAASVGSVECIQILLSFNADQTIKDAEGKTCLDVAEVGIDWSSLS